MNILTDKALYRSMFIAVDKYFKMELLTVFFFSETFYFFSVLSVFVIAC